MPPTSSTLPYPGSGRTRRARASRSPSGACVFRRCSWQASLASCSSLSNSSSPYGLALHQLVGKRHVEPLEKRLSFRVGSRRGDYDDVHPTHGIHTVIVDLGEDDLLPEAESEIAAPVEAPAGDAAEIAHPWQRHGDQAVEELVHALPAQGHLTADRHVLAQLESGDRSLGFRDYRMLTGDRGQVAGRGIGLLAVLHRFPDTDIYDDLLQARHLHRVLIPELLHQGRMDGRRIEFLQ